MLFADIFPLIMPEVAGCPSQTAKVAIIRATQELCRESGLWTVDLPAIQLVDGKWQYEIEPDLGSIERIESVSCQGVPLRGAGPSDLDLFLPGWREAKGNIPAFFNVDTTRALLNVYPTPDGATDVVIVKAVLAPTLNDSEIADEIYNHYGEAIEMGAKAKLMLQRNTQWFDAKMGEYFRQRFDIAVTDCRIEVEAGQVKSTTTVKPRRFG